YPVLISLGIPQLAINTVVITIIDDKRLSIALFTREIIYLMKIKRLIVNYHFLSVTLVDPFIVKSAICVHSWRNDVIFRTFINREYSIQCIYASYLFSILLHDSVINESNDLLPVVQSGSCDALHR